MAIKVRVLFLLILIITLAFLPNIPVVTQPIITAIPSRIPDPIPHYPLVPPRPESHEPVPIPEIPKIPEPEVVWPEMPPLQTFYVPKLPTRMSIDEPIDYSLKPDYSNIVTDIGDIALLPPELVLDLIIGSFDRLLGVRDPSGSVTARLFDFHAEPTRAHLFSVLIDNFAKREGKYFAGFGDSYLNTPEVEEGLAQIEAKQLMSDQRKILWDVGKNTYLSKYRIKVDNIKEEAFYFTDWRGIDFAVLPPLVGAYVYYRGLDKKFTLFGTEGKIMMEPLQSWVGHKNLLVGAGIEWSPKDWPVKLVMAVGLDKGDVDLQFIGIGTSIGTVKQLLFRQAEPR